MVWYDQAAEVDTEMVRSSAKIDSSVLGYVPTHCDLVDTDCLATSRLSMILGLFWQVQFGFRIIQNLI